MRNSLYYGDNLPIRRSWAVNAFDFPKGYSLKSGGGKRLVRDGEQGELEMPSSPERQP